MTTATDRELLIRIDERVDLLRNSMATKGDLSTAISTHCAEAHSKKSLAPPPPAGVNIQGKPLQVLITALAALASALAAYFVA